MPNGQNDLDYLVATHPEVKLERDENNLVASVSLDHGYIRDQTIISGEISELNYIANGKGTYCHIDDCSRVIVQYDL